MSSAWCVYIVSNNAHTLYCGVTTDVLRRTAEHKSRKFPTSFTARYAFDRLVYFEFVGTQRAAARRERQIKAWRREKKVALIQAMNPNWIDLSSRLAKLVYLA